MKQDTTARLEKVLQQVKNDEEASDFIFKYTERKFDYFYQYINFMIAEKKIDIVDIVEKSGISKNYIYHILNGTRKKPSRDKILAVCIATQMTYTQTNRALKIAKVGVLYPKDERDVRIAVAINNKVKDVTSLNLLLHEKGFNPLDI